MGFIKNRLAYYTGKITCNKNSKFIPAEVYYYDNVRLGWFLSGILNSNNCLILEDKVVYSAVSFSYLYMLEKRFNEMDIDAKVNYDLDFRCLMIPLSSILYKEFLHLGKSYSRFR